MDFLKLSLDDREKLVLETYPQASKIKQSLLSIAGTRVIWIPDTIFETMASEELDGKGKVFDTEGLKIKKGMRNHCHLNVANLCKSKGYGMVTGYGLNDDYWRQHSWAVDDGKIIETTHKRECYFGIMYDDPHWVDFILFESSSFGWC